MNMYRDLLFPAREHRFDLAQIGDMLDELGLSFEGFYVSAEVLTKYRSMFRDDRNATNLDFWRQFEARYPRHVREHVHFLVSQDSRDTERC